MRLPDALAALAGNGDESCPMLVDGAATAATERRDLTPGRPRQSPRRREGCAREGTPMAGIELTYGRALPEVLRDWEMPPEERADIDAWFDVSPEGRVCFAHFRSHQKNSIRMDHRLPDGGLCEYEYDVMPLYEAAAAAVERHRLALLEALRNGAWVAHWTENSAFDPWRQIKPDQWQELEIVHWLVLQSAGWQSLAGLIKGMQSYETRLCYRAQLIRGAKPLPTHVRYKPAVADLSVKSREQLKPRPGSQRERDAQDRKHAEWLALLSKRQAGEREDEHEALPSDLWFWNALNAQFNTPLPVISKTHFDKIVRPLAKDEFGAIFRGPGRPPKK